MDPGALRWLFLSAFAAGLLIEVGLDFLNRRQILRNAVLPERFARPPFAGRIAPETYARSRAYSLERMAFGGAARLWSAALALALLFSGILPSWDRLLGRRGGGGPGRGSFFRGGGAAPFPPRPPPFRAWPPFPIK